MQHLVTTLSIAIASFAVVVAAGGVSPIWMAPTNLNYPMWINSTFDADIYENFTANLGEWATVEVAIGSRGGRPVVLMDSKGILWIFGGVPERTNKFFSTAVWNYNPKTDQYRYVWKTSDSSPFVARNAGELHVADPSNHPGGIAYAGGVIDKNDNIWFYTYAYAGEVWMFNTTSWMFVRQFGLNGDTSGDPSIGANPGQPGEDVFPGYYEGQCMVIDSQENIWMLAGYNNYDDNVNTVWHFNTTSYLWTFITGSVYPAYIAHNSTYYGGTWMSGCDIDENDRVWTYGGWGNTDAGSDDDYGHLWTFDTRVKRQWEFEYGADPFRVLPQVVSEDFNADNRPPAAEGCALIDRRDGTLMVVPGGSYNANFDNGESNTIWLYSKSLKQWKLVYGDITAYDPPGNYSNYRAPGSGFRAGYYFGNNAGRNAAGDLFIVGGGIGSYTFNVPNYKDIWLIPQDQCVNNIHKCDANADCIEEMVGYSCKCKDGYTGDGFTCIAPPVADVPMSAPSSATPVASPSSTKTPSNKTSSASIVGVTFVAALGLIITL